MYQPPNMRQNSPEQTRNMIVAVVLSLVMIVGYTGYNMWKASKNPPPQQTATEAPQDPTAPRNNAPGVTTPDEGAAPRLGVTIPDNLRPTDNQPLSLEAALAAAPRVTIDSGRVRGSITLVGARIDRMQLKDYRQEVEKTSPPVEVLSPIGTEHSYYAQFGWAGAPGLEVPNQQTVWNADRDTLTPDNPVTLSWTNAAGVTFRQVLSIDRNYMISVRQEVENGSGDAVSVLPYGLISRGGTPHTDGYYILHEGLLGVFDNSLKETKYKDLQDDSKQEFSSTGGWLGITDKYWLAALIPDQSASFKASFHHFTVNGADRYQTDYLMGQQDVAAGQSASATARTFIGAKETLLLDAYRDNANVPLFDRAVDYGWFYFLTKPIFYAIHWLAHNVGNFGVAILILTFGIKLLFYPLADRSYRAMSKMKLLQPKMQELKEKYGDDRAKINTELMAIYKKEKVNPLAGCWPILIQIPVFFSLYKVLFVTIEMRHAPFFGWIHDLSAPDPLGLLTLFGLIHWDVPQILHVVNIGIWPLIMGATMFLQQRLNPAPTDPVQAKIFGLMPIIFTFLLASFPAGLVIYWAWNNSLSIAQQWTIMKRMGVSIGGGRVKNAPATASEASASPASDETKSAKPKKKG